MTGAALTAGAISRERLEPLVARGPAWLAGRRAAAWEVFTAQPLPSSHRDEDWRRTDIAKLRLEELGDPGPADQALVEKAWHRHARGLPGAALVLCGPDGSVRLENADSLQAQGVIVCPLQEAATRHPELLQRGLSGLGVDGSYFGALWNALWAGGVLIYVPHGVEAMTPVWVSHLAPAGGTVSFPGTVVVVDEHASLTLVEDQVGLGDGAQGLAPGLSVGLTALRLAEESHLDDIPVQQLPAQTWHFATRRATLAAAARYRLLGATLGAGLEKVYWDALLEGPGAEADVSAACLVQGRQHLDLQSLQLHRGRDTRSNLLYKVAARDRAESVYSGLIAVEPDAVHADGYVLNRNLLLSHGASASGVPRLEIRANDVRCGHGNSVGHVDDEERFYLMARGVPAEEADRLIVTGYFAEVLDRIPQESLRDWLAGLLEVEITRDARTGEAGASTAGDGGAAPTVGDGDARTGASASTVRDGVASTAGDAGTGTPGGAGAAPTETGAGSGPDGVG